MVSGRSICVVLVSCIILQLTDSLKVSIYYESLCPDSIRFIRDQLAPNYNDGLQEVLEVDLVPYGKANHTLAENGTWIFNCQHGAEECYGNKYQACALYQNFGQDKDVAYVNCVMSADNPASYERMSECADTVGIDFSKVEECIETEGDDILADLGDQTHSVEPTITFVPTVIYNDVYNQELQDLSLVDFKGVVCGLTADLDLDVCKEANTTDSPAQDSLKVSIYYESLCPDSIRFIRDQLAPNYNAGLQEVLELDLVPYGKANHTLAENGTWIFNCQHGAEECYGNKYQACALYQNFGQDKDVAYVNCVMSADNPASYERMSECADTVGIDFSKVEECFETEGDDILADLGDQTHSVEPTITFVPTIIYNDVYDQELQDLSLTDFKGVVCGLTADLDLDVCTETDTTDSPGQGNPVMAGSHHILVVSTLFFALLRVVA